MLFTPDGAKAGRWSTLSYPFPRYLKLSTGRDPFPPSRFVQAVLARYF